MYSAYACISAQVEDRPILSFMLAILATTLILRLWTQTGQNKKAQQKTCGIANNDSGMTSQLTKQPTTLSAVGEGESQGPDLKTAFKVACWVIAISAGGIVSVLIELLGKERTEITHIVLLKAYTTLNYMSLLLAIGLIIVTLKRPNIRGLIMIIKYIMWSTVGSVTCALGCATSIVLPNSSVEVVLILIVPFVLVLLIIILSN